MFSACAGTKPQSFSWQSCICKKRFPESKETQDLKHTQFRWIHVARIKETRERIKRKKGRRNIPERPKDDKRKRKRIGWGGETVSRMFLLKRFICACCLGLLAISALNLEWEIKSCRPWRPQRKSTNMFWNSQQHKGLTESAGKIRIPEFAERAEWLYLYYILKACTSQVMGKCTLLSS